MSNYRLLDLFCGRFGWSRAFAARGWECWGLDLAEPAGIPPGCHFEQVDILTICANVNSPMWIGDFMPGMPDFVCCSSPCEQFSVHGMKHFHKDPPWPTGGMALFRHAEALCESLSVPYIMENVRAAQQFVGNAGHHCGPFYLWGPGVPPILPQGIKKGFQTGGTIIQKLKRIDRQALTDYRRQNDGSWSSSKSAKRKEWTAKAATIPPELAACVAEYAERICEVKRQSTA